MYNTFKGFGNGKFDPKPHNHGRLMSIVNRNKKSYVPMKSVAFSRIPFKIVS